jgi:hypothetical protein
MAKIHELIDAAVLSAYLLLGGYLTGVMLGLIEGEILDYIGILGVALLVIVVILVVNAIPNINYHAELVKASPNITLLHWVFMLIPAFVAVLVYFENGDVWTFLWPTFWIIFIGAVIAQFAIRESGAGLKFDGRKSFIWAVVLVVIGLLALFFDVAIVVEPEQLAGGFIGAGVYPFLVYLLDM